MLLLIIICWLLLGTSGLTLTYVFIDSKDAWKVKIDANRSFRLKVLFVFLFSGPIGFLSGLGQILVK